MKKSYIQPLIEVRQIAIEKFLCVSGVEQDFVDETINEPTQILSKQSNYDVWADDEEE